MTVWGDCLVSLEERNKGEEGVELGLFNEDHEWWVEAGFGQAAFSTWNPTREITGIIAGNRRQWSKHPQCGHYPRPDSQPVTMIKGRG